MIAEWVAHNVGALEALVIVLSLDAYLREQDWEMLRCEDVYVELRGKDVPSVALLFGRRHRGESVKTGQDQGVCVEDEFVARAIAGLVEGRPRDENIFGFSSSHFRKVWAKALEALDLQWVGPPHTLRHSGPSFDASTGRRDLEQTRRRGRWKQLKSVERYAKGHALTMHLSRLPRHLKEKGRELKDNFHRVFLKAWPASDPRPASLRVALSPLLRRDGAKQRARSLEPPTRRGASGKRA